MLQSNHIAFLDHGCIPWGKQRSLLFLYFFNIYILIMLWQSPYSTYLVFDVVFHHSFLAYSLL